MRHTLSTIFGAGFTAIVCWAFGSLAFHALRIRLARLEQDLLAAVVGAAILSAILFWMSVAQLVYTPVLLGVGVFAVAAGWWYRRRDSAPRLPELAPGWRILFLLPFLFYAAVYLANSMAPEISPDGSTYHLGLVYRYYRMHGFDRNYVTFFSSLSQGMEMLYVYAFSFGRQSAAATLHLLSLMALAGLLLCFGRRAGRPAVGVMASLLVYLSPVVGIDAVSAYNDVGLAAAGFAVFGLLEIWREEQSDSLLIPIGLAAGFCFAIKYTGGVALVYAATVVLWERRPRALWLLCLTAGLVAVPWVARDWLWFGNPVSPLFNRYFPNPHFHIATEESLRNYFRTYDLKTFRPLFYMLTTSGELGGQLGPLFLGAPLALAAAWTRFGRHALLACLIFLLPYPSNLGARFLIPALPFAALAIAEGIKVLLGRLTRRSLFAPVAVIVTAAAVLAWPRVINTYRAAAGGWQIAHVPWQAALGIVPADEWQLKYSPVWVVARMLDTFVPDGQKVWSSSPVGEAYARTDVRVSWQSAEAEVVEDILYTATRNTFRWRYDFPARPFRQIRLRQTGAAGGLWSIAELHFYDGGREVRPRLLRASPNPWDGELANDGNPVTRWRTWESMRPGQYMEATFAGIVSLDRVEADMPADPFENQTRIDGVEAKPQITENPADPNARMQAIQAIRARGFGWLLINDDHFSAADILANPERWGLHLVADRGAARLYQIR